MSITLETKPETVESWFAKTPILFCHFALRITVNGESSYRDFVFCQDSGYTGYIEQSDLHFSNHYSLIHWAKTPREAETLSKQLPKIESLSASTTATTTETNPASWRFTDRCAQPFPSAKNQPVPKENEQLEDTRRVGYRQILAKNFPNLVGHYLCSIGFARSTESAGYALAIYYILNQPEEYLKLPSSLIQNGIIHLSSELMRCIAEIDDAHNRAESDLSLTAAAFDLVLGSRKALGVAERLRFVPREKPRLRLRGEQSEKRRPEEHAGDHFRHDLRLAETRRDRADQPAEKQDDGELEEELDREIQVIHAGGCSYSWWAAGNGNGDSLWD